MDGEGGEELKYEEDQSRISKFKFILWWPPISVSYEKRKEKINDEDFWMAPIFLCSIYLKIYSRS